MENYTQIFAFNLNRYMSKRGKVQSDLINDLKLKQSTVSAWMNGLKLPRMDKVQLLAEYLGVDVLDLLERSKDIEYKRSNDISHRFNDLIAELSLRNTTFELDGQELTPKQLEIVQGILVNSLENIRLMVKLSK